MNKQSFSFSTVNLFLLYFLIPNTPVYAQITSDGTLSTQVNSSNNLDFIIKNGNRSGENLFHSFKEFSIPSGGSVTFVNDLGIKNIITRITGTSTSNIDGLLKTNGSANLFLINPNGIVFGKNASLNIGGSLFTTTASSLVFADGSQFSATNPQALPLLTVSVPVGLQFGQVAKPIQFESTNLQLSNGQTLAALGGDIAVKGSNLSVPGGRIQLGSVAPGSFVKLTPINQDWLLGYVAVSKFQDIKISERALIATSDVGAGAGAIELRGKQIAIANRSEVGSVTLGNIPGQPISLEASDTIEMSDFSILASVSFGTAAAGDINIKAKSLLLRQGIIDASTNNLGAGGNINIKANGIDLFGVIQTGSNSRQLNGGDAGKIDISTQKLVLNNGGRISTTTSGTGDAGDILINAGESVTATGVGIINKNSFSSGIFSETKVQGFAPLINGNGGDIIVNTPRLFLKDGASISVAAINGSNGKAGILDINSVDSLTVAGSSFDTDGKSIPSSLLAISQGAASAGDLRIRAGKLIINDGGIVSVSSNNFGKAGDLQITANRTLLDNQGKIAAETMSGFGNINLNSQTLILRRGSSITTNAKGENISGGDININTEILAAFENSDISANSVDFRGGNITINTQSILGTEFRTTTTPDSDITATGANSSLNGNVIINTPDIDPSSSLIELPDSFSDRSRLITQGCPAFQGNSFTIIGRGGLPNLPNDMIRSNQTATIDWVKLNPPQTTQPPKVPKHHPKLITPKQIVEANSWIVNQSGEVELVTLSFQNHVNNFVSSGSKCNN
ncbi:filamentous hemagglutinin N-terminal domain-containing protein [Calothrix sp. PCC 6303]|uniref:two-partner secretion domain-containing protein n=1 Tax=Calothrix sp. PCC 6303 TaxID=1170562 RepID=UPI0002A04124|nr:filamentous hemagglutinin N-terminal domain-containing protein [Calothrix sp. PCC 6303]AFZ03840.1 filamentous hemagglutinin family outer membrane protein [Calothrix sp. PCC 6303]